MFGRSLFLPVAGWGTLRHLVLPGLALGAPFAAYISRLTRTGMLEVLSQDYIRTAHAKGLMPRTRLLRHALKGGDPARGLLPRPRDSRAILTGSLVIEKIFAIPGTGSHFVNSALNRDYTLSMGVTILYTVLVYALNADGRPRVHVPRSAHRAGGDAEDVAKIHRGTRRSLAEKTRSSGEGPPLPGFFSARLAPSPGSRGIFDSASSLRGAALQ